MPEKRKHTNRVLNNIIDAAAKYKYAIISAPKYWEYDLTGLTPEQIISDQEKISFVGKTTNIYFDIFRLMVGVVSADSVGSSDIEDSRNMVVRVSYPHEFPKVSWTEQITKKSVFTMTLDDAVFLLNRCAEVLEIPKEVLKPAIEGYSKYTYLGEEAMKLHQDDIAPALAKKL